MRIALRLYRLLLKLYPAGFRESYGGPLQRDFQDEYAEVRGAGDRVRFWKRTLMDFLRSMPAQLVSEFRQDARHAFRQWRQRPLAPVFTIVVLAIAIGANTGIFSVLNATLLRSLPFREPERLAALHMFTPPGANKDPVVFHEWRQKSAYLEDAAPFVTTEVTLEAAAAAVRSRLAETSWNFFALLGTEPAPGRAFASGEDVPGRTSVAIIGRGVWHQVFGDDPRAIGASIRLNGVPFTIVGVAPPGFDFPDKTQVWTPTTFDWQRVSKSGVVFWRSIGRLRPEVSWRAARTAFDIEWRQRDPKRDLADAPNRPRLIPLHEQLTGPVRDASLMLMAGVALLLLLACANVANLLMSRTAARSTELMIRTLLGASRARLAQQLLTEAVLLSAIAAAAGLVVAFWTAGVATAAQPAGLATQSYAILDWRVLGFAIVLAVTTGLVFGVGPALYAGRADSGSPNRTSTAAPRRTRTRSALIVLQLGVTIVLLTGSVALGRAFLALLRIDNGYQVRSLATMSVAFAGTPYAAADRGRAYYEEVVRRVRDVAGVVAVSATESLPLNVDSFMGGHFTLDNQGPESGITTVTLVSPGFFDAIGGRVLFGREFVAADWNGSEPVAIINDTLAQTLGDRTTIVGRSLTAPQGKPRQIVGVVRDLRFGGPTSALHPQAFFLSRAPQTMTIVAKVAGRARDRIAIIRDAVQSVDPKVAVFNVKTMEERLDETLARPKFYATAVVFFGGLALLLAVIGVYGVVSYAVVQRTREIGIRLALGTTPARLRRKLLGQTGLTVALGVVPGAALAIVLGRFANSLVIGADTALANTSATAMLLTIVVAGVAIWTATRHIARLDIVDVIRSETGE
jgi:putative ABC transport system permease protein